MTRSSAPQPKVSDYVVTPVSNAEALLATLTLAYGSCGRVQKERRLYRIGRTHVHLDRVAGLGDFLELEVVLGTHESAADGIREATALMETLGITADSLVEGSHLDLLGRCR